MSDSVKPLVNAFSRVWLIEGRARADHQPSYMSRLKMGPLNQGFGSINSIYDPDPDNYGKFVEAGSFRDAAERPSTSLMGHYASLVKSKMMDLARIGCDFDIQLHIGECNDPSIFNDFAKILIMEKSAIETYSTEDMGALEPGDQSKVDETGEISALKIYEFVPLSFSLRSPAAVTNELVDVVICDSISCGDCDEESSGCEKIYAVTIAAGGSPSTPADVVYSIDKGLNWYAHDVDTMDVAIDAAGVACMGAYLVVIDATNGGALHYALLNTIVPGDDPAFTAQTDGFVLGATPNDIWSVGRKAFIVGNLGYIYVTTDPTGGVAVIDAGVATVVRLNAVHAISEDFAVAVGDDGTVVVINNDLAGLTITQPVGIGINLNCVWVVSKTEFWVGDSAGDLWFTLDGGTTWTEQGLPGTAPTEVEDIAFASASVGYISAVVDSHARIYVTVDGGYSWDIAERGTGLIPLTDSINAIAACTYDVDFLVGVGLADLDADGAILIGSD